MAGIFAFCGKKSQNKDKRLFKVSTDAFRVILEKKALNLNDFNLLSRVGDFSQNGVISGHTTTQAVTAII